MMEHLPQEIFDSIIDHIPGKKLNEFLPEHDTSVLGCTLVNRAFSASARRRLFSTMYIPVESDVTQKRLGGLFDLLQKPGDLAHLVQTISIKLGEYPISDEYDILLSRIVGHFEIAPRLTRLCIGGYSINQWVSLENIIPLSRRAIKDLLPRTQDLSLLTIRVPHDFLGDVHFLPTLRLKEAIVIPPSSIHLNSFLPRAIDTLIIHGSKSELSEWYKQRCQTLPGFCKLYFEVRDTPSTLLMSEVLSNSTHTLTTLDIQQTKTGLIYPPVGFDFSLFVNLTDLRLSFVIKTTARPLTLAGQYLNLGALWLDRSPEFKRTSLVHIKLTIIYCDWFPLHDKAEDFGQIEPLIDLNPTQLRIKHPNIQSLVVEVPLSQFEPYFPYTPRAPREELRKATVPMVAFMKSSLELAILGSSRVADIGVCVSVGAALGPNMENVLLKPEARKW